MKHSSDNHATDTHDDVQTGYHNINTQNQLNGQFQTHTQQTGKSQFLPVLSALPAA